MHTTRLVGAILFAVAPLAGLGCGTSASTTGGSSSSSAAGESNGGQSSGDSTGHSSSTSVAQVTNHSTASSCVGMFSTQGSTCGAVGQACCVSSGGIVAVSCNVGVTCCEPQAICAVDCTKVGDAGADADADAGPACGSIGDAGHAVSGSCPAGQQCCDDGHTGDPFVFDCIPITTACVPKP